ncbi:MAG: hypothetical protein INF18_00305 [Methylobacterium sp.]|nr:hypothetical protein [Methylobacterium sp.]MCA3638946.1 hypothetical protein [Methylobacterium sp.]
MSVDQQRMIDTAVSFFLGGERCRPGCGFRNYPVHELAAPVIVCYAIAVEIALKLLILKKEGVKISFEKIQTHDLKKLFNDLSDENKSNMQYFNELFIDFEIRNIEEDQEGFFIDSGMIITEKSAKIYQPFVDWRYPHEKDFLTADPDKLRRAFIVCHREIRRTSPNLKSAFERDWGDFDPDWIWNEIELQEAGSNP